MCTQNMTQNEDFKLNIDADNLEGGKWQFLHADKFILIIKKKLVKR